MNTNLKIIIVLLFIAAIIISSIFVVIIISDYLKTQDLINKTRTDNIIKNCIPNETFKEMPVEIIRNQTHSFQLQTCMWIESTNTIDSKSKFTYYFFK